MHLSEGEKILKVYHHHPTPFVFMVLKAVLGALPFFVLLYMFRKAFSAQVFVLLFFAILLILSLAIVYVSLVYWLDRIIITNLRIVYIDYKYLTVRDESQAFLKDIQDILTKENGILSYWKIFDYGTLILDTASSYVTLTFNDAPSPESIRQFIYHVRQQ